MTMRASFGALAILLFSCGTAASAEGSCGPLAKATSLEISLDRSGGADVPVAIAGRKFNMLVDTGGIYSLLTQQAATSLNLPLLHMNRVQLRMYGGGVIDTYVKAEDIQLGQLTASHWKFPVIASLPPGVEGTLSPDILRNYDVDFDFASSKLNLFSQDHCPGRVVYWTRGQIARIPIDIDMWGHITIPVELDGKKIKAAIDTGASRSFMSLEQAEDKFDFSDNDPRLKSAAPEFGHSAKAFTYPFKTLSLEGVTVANPDVVLVPNRESRVDPAARFILGMDTLRQLHLYIAYKEHTLYVTSASANEQTPAADPAAWNPRSPEIPLSLHCTSPDFEGTFKEDGPPGFASAEVTFGINAPAPADGVRVTPETNAVCTIRPMKETVIASSTFALEGGSQEILKHVDINEEVVGDNARPDAKAFIFTVKAKDANPSTLALKFQVAYRQSLGSP